MREEDVDKILKNKISDEIKAPESLKSRISYEINNMGKKKNSKTKLRVIQSIAAVAVFSILGVTTYAAVTKNPILEKLGLIKGNEIYEEVAEDINQDLSNEYAKITLKRMASDNAYAIMQYNVVLNYEGIRKFGKIEKDTHSGYGISIYNTIKINDKELDVATNRTEYVNKISDTEYDIYQIIQIASIEDDDLKIQISEKSLSAGVKNTKINKEVIINATKNQNTQKFNNIQKKIDNKIITVESFQNTSFETFIKVSVDIKNLKEENLEDFYSKDNPVNLSFTVLDTNNNYLPHICYTKVSYLENENGEKLDILNGYEKGHISFNNTTAHMEFIITLGKTNKEIFDIKLIPYVSILPDDRADDYEEQFNNLDWHKLQSGEYKQKNSLGGEIELTKMEADDEKIKFAYNLTGSITNVETPVLLRVKDERLGFNVIYPTNVYIKGVNAEENYVEFYRNGDVTGVYSKNFEDEEDFKIKDISKVEFALLEKIDVDLLDVQVNLTIPKQNNQFLTIKKVETKEIENYDGIKNDDEIKEDILSNLPSDIFTEKDNVMGNIKIGMTDNEIKSILGEPNAIIGKEEMIEGGEFQYQYEDISITFIKNNEESIAYLIDNIGIENKGPRGVSIGDTKEDVINKFYHENDGSENNAYEIYLYIFGNMNEYCGYITEDNIDMRIRYLGDKYMFEVIIDGTERVTAMNLQKSYY